VSITNINFFMIHTFTLPHTSPLYFFLKEIKLRAVYSVLGGIFAFCMSYAYSEDLLYWIIQPNNVIQSHFVFLNISEALYTTLKIAGLTTLCTCIPFWWYHIWSFLVPSCTCSERKKIYTSNNFISNLFWFKYLVDILCRNTTLSQIFASISNSKIFTCC